MNSAVEHIGEGGVSVRQVNFERAAGLDRDVQIDRLGRPRGGWAAQARILAGDDTDRVAVALGVRDAIRRQFQVAGARRHLLRCRHVEPELEAPHQAL